MMDHKNDEKDIFYFQGKCFDNPEDMFAYEKEWKKFPLDQETADRILNHLKKDIICNIFLFGKQFNNSEFSNLVQKIFEFSIKQLNNN